MTTTSIARKRQLPRLSVTIDAACNTQSLGLRAKLSCAIRTIQPASQLASRQLSSKKQVTQICCHAHHHLLAFSYSERLNPQSRLCWHREVKRSIAIHNQLRLPYASSVVLLDLVSYLCWIVKLLGLLQAAVCTGRPSSHPQADLLPFCFLSLSFSILRSLAG